MAFSSAAFVLIPFPSSAFNTVCKALVTPSFVIAQPSNSTPIFHTKETDLAFMLWSPKKGRRTMGTPAVMVSNTEFQPQWVANAPTAAWRRTSDCSAQLTTRDPGPPPVRSKNSGVRSSSASP